MAHLRPRAEASSATVASSAVSMPTEPSGAGAGGSAKGLGIAAPEPST